VVTVIVPPLKSDDKPAVISTDPPCPLCPDPTVIAILPPLPEFTFPVPIKMVPEFPVEDDPVLITIDPLTPVPATFAVVIEISPVGELKPLPDEILTAPPEDVVDLPAVI